MCGWYLKWIRYNIKDYNTKVKFIKIEILSNKDIIINIFTNTTYNNNYKITNCRKLEKWRLAGLRLFQVVIGLSLNHSKINI